MSPKEKVDICLKVLSQRSLSKDQQLWAPELIQHTTVESADFDESTPAVTFRLATQSHFANSYGYMHGGCLTTFIDNATTWAAFGDPKYWKDAKSLGDVIRSVVGEFGVSRNLNSTFIRPIPLNQDVLLTCKIQGNSKRYMYITYELVDALNGKKLAVGHHDKAKPAASKL